MMLSMIDGMNPCVRGGRNTAFGPLLQGVVGGSLYTVPRGVRRM